MAGVAGTDRRAGHRLWPVSLPDGRATGAVPLPWWQTPIAVLAAASQLAWLLWLQPAPLDASVWNQLWLFGLIVAVCAWTSPAQLHLLVRLLAARSDASHDPLTGLASRHHANARMHTAFAAAVRRGDPLLVLMLDLDHFKRINDRHGHAGGDCVLAALARSLQRELRETDLAARHGGEEFLVVAPACNAVDALATAERIRAAVVAFVIAVPDGD